MAVWAAGSSGVGPGVKRRFLRNMSRVLDERNDHSVYRNWQVQSTRPPTSQRQASSNERDTNSMAQDWERHGWENVGGGTNGKGTPSVVPYPAQLIHRFSG